MLEEIENLTRNHCAKFTLVIHDGVSSASWKVPGNRTETVAAYRPTESVMSVLQGLMERLGRFRNVPNNAVLWERMTPGQRVRFKQLLSELKDLKREVLNPTPIDVIEPCLASPRSALNPDHFSTFAMESEVRDRGLAADANRGSYQASERNAYGPRARRYGDAK
jgi:hypothetical protein